MSLLTGTVACIHKHTRYLVEEQSLLTLFELSLNNESTQIFSWNTKPQQLDKRWQIFAREKKYSGLQTSILRVEWVEIPLPSEATFQL